jgi:hypothetical protein
MKERMDARFVGFARVWSSVWSRRAELSLGSRASGEAAQPPAARAVRVSALRLRALLAVRVSALRLRAVLVEAAAVTAQEVARGECDP